MARGPLYHETLSGTGSVAIGPDVAPLQAQRQLVDEQAYHEIVPNLFLGGDYDPKVSQVKVRVRVKIGLRPYGEP